VAVGRPSLPSSPTAAPAARAASKPRPFPLWVGAAAAAAAVALLAGGGFFVARESLRAPQPATVGQAVEDAELAGDAPRLRGEEELAKVRVEAAARSKADQEAARRRQIEDEERRKTEADLAAKQREEEARQKA